MLELKSGHFGNALELKNALELEHGAAVPLERRNALERKNASGRTLNVTPELQKYMDEMAAGFKAYRRDLEGQVSDLQKRLDEALLEGKRPMLTSGETKVELPQGWSDYLRKGFTHGLEEKALSAGSDPDFGYTIPRVLADRITSVARDRSNIRAIASVVSITGNQYELPQDPNDLDADWVGETAGRPETSTPQLTKLVIPVHEIYAMPKATQTILDDSATNIEEWLANRVRDVFDRKENIAFVNGDGVSKPRGFLSYPTVAQASWSWGNIGYIATGQATFDADPDGVDDFIDTVYALKSEYRANARWLMNSKTAGTVRKMRDGDDNYIWQQSLIAGQPSTLLGYPVSIAEDMPDVGDGNFPVAFGDFQRGYLIVDRIGIRMLRDPFSAKPDVMFYTTKRVGGAVENFDAIKLIKTAAS